MTIFDMLLCANMLRKSSGEVEGNKRKMTFFDKRKANVVILYDYAGNLINVSGEKPNPQAAFMQQHEREKLFYFFFQTLMGKIVSRFKCKEMPKRKVVAKLLWRLVSDN